MITETNCALIELSDNLYFSRITGVDMRESATTFVASPNDVIINQACMAVDELVITGNKFWHALADRVHGASMCGNSFLGSGGSRSQASNFPALIPLTNVGAVRFRGLTLRIGILAVSCLRTRISISCCKSF